VRSTRAWARARSNPHEVARYSSIRNRERRSVFNCRSERCSVLGAEGGFGNPDYFSSYRHGLLAFSLLVEPTNPGVQLFPLCLLPISGDGKNIGRSSSLSTLQEFRRKVCEHRCRCKQGNDISSHKQSRTRLRNGSGDDHASDFCFAGRGAAQVSDGHHRYLMGRRRVHSAATWIRLTLYSSHERQ